MLTTDKWNLVVDGIRGWVEGGLRVVGTEVLKYFEGRTAQRNGGLVNVARLPVRNQNSCLLLINRLDMKTRGRHLCGGVTDCSPQSATANNVTRPVVSDQAIIFMGIIGLPCLSCLLRSQLSNLEKKLNEPYQDEFANHATQMSRLSRADSSIKRRKGRKVGIQSTVGEISCGCFQTEEQGND
jgi:hypothetical protein